MLSSIVSDNDSVGRMLEDPSYSQIVRWGDDNDSFVVLEVRRTSMPHFRSGSAVDKAQYAYAIVINDSHISSAKNSPNQYFRSTSNTVILRASSDNSTSTTSIKSAKIMKSLVNHPTDPM